MNVYEKWKTNLKTSNPTSLDVAAYAIARSLNTEDPLGKALYLLYACFPPIKNKHKLLNGKYPYSFLESIVSSSRMHESSKIYSHNKLKSALLDIFDIPNSKELNELLMDISKNIDVNYSKPYSYVVVRSDLEQPQKVVQACHAIQEVTMKYPESHHNTRMIVLQVPSENDLIEIENRLKISKPIKFHTFYEPDGDVGYTSLATAPITNRYLRNFFAKYPLLD